MKLLSYLLSFGFAVALAAGCTQRSGQPAETAVTPDSATTVAADSAEKPAPQTTSKFNLALDQLTPDRYWNDFARYLGGLSPQAGSLLDSIEYRPEAGKHRDFFEAEWRRKNAVLFDKLREWSGQEFAAQHKGAQDVLYPFSGPDFATVHTLFPNAPRYVMFGLEPEGKLIDVRQIPKAALPSNLQNLRVSLDDILLSTFFKTNDMKVDLKRNEIQGTLPILLAFIARTGNEVLQVRRFRLLAGNKLDYLPANDTTPQSPDDEIYTGLEIVFRKNEKDAPAQVLHYLSFNAADSHFKNNAVVAEFLETLKPAICYVKSASYLMHNTYFSTVRNLVFNTANFVLQDDTGIAYRYWDQNIWSLQFYGKYGDLVPLFKNRYQNDVAKIYEKDSLVKPLNFGLGYTNRNSNCNLMIARKKTQTP